MKKKIIVVGAGGAGLTAAVAAAKKGAEVLLLSKTACGDANCTAYSGGLFSLSSGTVTPEDHFRRVVEIGRGVNDRKLVRTLAEESEKTLRTLADWGVTLKITDSGRATVRESAPSEIMGGRGLTRELAAIARAEGVSILENCVATKILAGERGAEGLEWVNWKTGRKYRSPASAVILASGGGGRIYSRTDNPARMTGDGYALALEAGLDLADMEYVQFYPLGWKDPAFPLWMVGLAIVDYIPVTDENGREFLREAILSWGLTSGKEANYFARDKSAIFLSRHERQGGKTLLHLENLGEEMLTIPDVRVSLMLDLPPERRTGPVELSPIQHYFTGGIPIDTEGRTALPGLYACGEVTGGVDGASRMGGNALTNIVTFGLRAGRFSAEEAGEGGIGDVTEIPADLSFLAPEGGIRPRDAGDRLRAVVQEGLGPCRSGDGLRRCAAALEEWKVSCPPLKVGDSVDLLHALEMKGLAFTAEAVARAALLREESRGVHYRDDFPEEREEWMSRILVSAEKGKIAAAREG
ncbi:FAD-binding protein [Aminivibrio sp.]|jgi:succinate dehydrogenase/fumarate reductase flavoprotein subunit|uniref:FAD-binding protein n=1 Tax=Aminivibrio sp. TaxID=1872489 RepID=UPI001A4AA9F3|nr:FAD-binding protein [Aminivibrio sp.]MBL3540351.1 FAD-dependent oxidoreductase [Aminivibrio sp.]MDK2958920.1 fumarate reductase (CoM/CoB) subunit [Synergistaceae bacterium]